MDFPSDIVPSKKLEYSKKLRIPSIDTVLYHSNMPSVTPMTKPVSIPQRRCVCNHCSLKVASLGNTVKHSLKTVVTVSHSAATARNERSSEIFK